MTDEQKKKVQYVNENRSTQGSDYVRCEACDKKRIAEGKTHDICQPWNSDEDLLCPCGDVRLPYDCQLGIFDMTYQPQT